MTEDNSPSDPSGGLSAVDTEPAFTPSVRAPMWPWLLGLATLSALVVVVLHVADLERFAALARQSRPLWLLAGCAVQGCTYLCLAVLWRAVLIRAGYRVRLLSLMRLAVAKLFADQAVPTGGVSGLVLVLRGLGRRGFPKGVAAGTLIVGILSFYAAYLVLALLAMALLWWHGKLGYATILAGLGLLGFASVISGAVMLLRRWSRNGPPAWAARLRWVHVLLDAGAAAPGALLNDRRLLLEAGSLQFLIFLLDAVTLWLCFIALGETPSFWVVLAGFCLASIAATLGPIPLGLGTFEAGAVATLSLLGQPLETALAATLLFRGLSFWIPMAPGLWLARRELRPRRARPGVPSSPA
jgi:uncharacterized membrane protein YbhN (UPF0104 family)